MTIELLRAELTDYYRQWRIDRPAEMPECEMAVRREILAAMDRFAGAHPGCHPSLLKARLHEEMAERCTPVIFPHSPFFFEMGARFSENWGTPWSPELTLGSWLMHHQQHLLAGLPEKRYLHGFQLNVGEGSLEVWNAWNGFDNDHHCPGYTKLLRVGMNGLLAEIDARRAQPCSEDQAANLEAMARSCRALLRMAGRFAERARLLLADEQDPQARQFLTMIADTAGRIPAEPPRTFYEGLAMLWFLREAIASFEAIGVSVLGHLDRQLYGLYRDDLAAGRLTEAEARDLLARWMLPTDVKFHLEDNPWPETSTCLELGGCDEEGRVVWNDVTRLIIETHHTHGLINPKLNCRYSADAPADYLDLLSRTMLAGHNHFALLNDDVLIPACVRAGKTEREARLYVNGGCQETIVEGVEHSAGAYYYFCLPRVLDLCLQRPAVLPDDFPAEAAVRLPLVITDAGTFEDYYQAFMDTLKDVMAAGAGWLGRLGREQWRLHPCPLFSPTLEGCIERGLDYTRGGAKYNPSGIALVGLGTTCDSLYAIRTAVFEHGWLTLEELSAWLARNWEGNERLRARLQRLPKFGQGVGEVDALAARIAAELGEFVPTLPGERGGPFQGSFFVYYFFEKFAHAVRATPDGRHAGELLTQGIAPDRAAAPESLTDIVHSLSHIDFRAFSGNAVLDTQVPLGRGIPAETLTAVMRTFARLGGPTLQLNCVSLDDLRDAQLHPEQHRDLVVRISGLSAHFVCLTRAVQDEIIGRAVARV